MSITGGVKFFEGAKNLFRDGSVGVASTNDASSKYILDYNINTLWESVGSNDITQETIEITFSESKTFDRLFIINHNLKQYQVKYWNGSAYVDFTNAIGINSEAKGAVSETTYARDTSYYEFDEVSATKIKIFMDTTQTVDAEKEITNLYVTSELGTFEGYPRISKIKHSRNIRKAKMLSGKSIIQKSYQSVSFKISMKTYPLQNDIDISNTLHDSEDSFLVWLRGGRTGSSYFRFENRGWRLEDVFHMDLDRDTTTDYEKGIYINGVNIVLSLTEVI